MWEAQVAFQVRLRPGTYRIGQQTVGADKQIDPAFSNSSIEYYTKGDEHGSHVLTGLLVKLRRKSCSNSNVSSSSGSGGGSSASISLSSSSSSPCRG